MTGRELFRRVTRRRRPWREVDLTKAENQAALWAAVLESPQAGGHLARALERQPWRLEDGPHEFVRWLTAVEGFSDGRAGKVAAVLGLAGQIRRLVERSDNEGDAA